MPFLLFPRIRQILLATTLALCSGPLWAGPVDDLVAEAEQRVQAQDFEGAYALLDAQRMTYAGDPDFDYWLGMLAVRTGKPSKAIFPLERVLAQEPGHAGARMELATAYVALGQQQNASRELELLEQQSPPPAAAQRIEELKKAVAIQSRNEERRTRVLYVGLEGGHDDNVGSWPETTIDFGFFTLPFEPVDSAYTSLQAGVYQRLDVSGTQSVNLSANGSTRQNSQDDAEQFDQDYLSGTASWNYDMDGRHTLSAGAEAAVLRLDGENYYSLYGLYGEWRNRLSDARSYYARAGLRQVSFNDDEGLDVYDYQQTRLLTGVTYQLNSRWRLKLDLNLDYEAAINDRPGGDALVYGLASELVFQMTARQRVGASGHYAHADYRREFAVGQAFNNEPEDRRDDRGGAGLFWEMYPTNSIQVRARADYREQASSLETYDYDQTSGALAVNYYF